MRHLINSPAHFRYPIDAMFFAINTLYFAIAQKEQIHSKETLEEPPKEDLVAFDISSRNIERPHQFLQVLLDVIRMNYEPEPLGTTLLNSNICFLYDAIPCQPFELAYLSLVSEPDESFGDFWEKTIEPYARALGCDLNGADSLFVICSTGEKRYLISLVTETNEILHCVPTVKEFVSNTVSIVADQPTLDSRENCCAGFCLDNALGSRLRVSLWAYLPL